ncbi:MAG: hypothetical protein HY692_09975, partial [Cyanobacteria bacterium NC_groundwater_1444_Ag_S-0.65um_54_12]|nr:hypothetical protein [Cyanobacteria bacterium NC_groundwater_1444_Ag_S-0.65um_54_12]
MTRRSEKLKQTIAEDRKRLLLRARKLPYARFFGGVVFLLGTLAITIIMGGMVGILLGTVAGLVLTVVTRKVLQSAEQTLALWLYRLANTIEIMEQQDPKEKAGAPNALLDEFRLFYQGGHPIWQPEKAEFGILQVYERAVVFKNLKNRFRLPLVRINGVALENHTKIRIKKLPAVVIPAVKISKNKLVATVWEFVRKRQRFLVIDYTDDNGNQRWIVFYPDNGNSRTARQFKEVVDSAIKQFNRRHAKSAIAVASSSAAAINQPASNPAKTSAATAMSPGRPAPTRKIPAAT